MILSRFCYIFLLVFSSISNIVLFSYSQDLSRPYRIATVEWIGWSPLQVAKDKGFWKEQGIAVEPVIYDDPSVILEAIKAKRIDFAMDMVGSLIGIYMKGESVVILAETNWSHGGDKIIIQKGRELEDCKGKPLGVFLNLPSCLFFLGQFLQTRDMSVSDFRIVELKPEDLTAQFIAGRLPVILNYDPHNEQAIREGNGRVLATSADYEGCIPECIWIYEERLKGILAEDIQKVLKGWIKAIQWIHESDNWEEYQRIVNEKTFIDHEPFSELELKKLYKAVRIHSLQKLSVQNQDEGGLYAYLNELNIFLKKNRLLYRDFDAHQIFNNDFIMNVLQTFD